MENMLDFMLYLGLLGIMFTPLLIMTWFCEETKIGRHFMTWLLWKLGLDD